ncbi:hypothetical protein ACFL6C_12530, partial [Myxococcota bacterium]
APTSTKLANFGIDKDGNNVLDETELNDLGRKAMARGFFVIDEVVGGKVITPELAEKAAKEVDGKFTARGVLNESRRGLKKTFIEPFVKHKIRTPLILATAVALCVLVPIAGLFAAGAGAGIGLHKLGKGIVRLAKAIRRRDWDAAESAFRDIAPGALITIASMIALVTKVTGLLAGSDTGASGASSGASGGAAGVGSTTATAAAACPGGT